MEYTTADIGTLKIHMTLWTVIFTFLILTISLVSVIKVPYNMKPGYQTDNAIRRIIFFFGLVISALTVFLFHFNYLVDSYRPMIYQEDLSIVIQALSQYIVSMLITSVVMYLSLFVLIAFTTKRWIGYKPYTVLKSNNKWFGLF
jgi:hypothetical protein